MAENTNVKENKYKSDNFAGTKKRIAKTLLYIFNTFIVISAVAVIIIPKYTLSSSSLNTCANFLMSK